MPVESLPIPVPNTIFSYAQIKVSPGSHYITADEPLGLMVYGYGQAISYGYLGGLRLPKTPTSVETENLQHTEFNLAMLEQPVRDGLARVQFSLPQSTMLSLELYGINGHKIKNIASTQRYGPGTPQVEIDLSELPNGMYFCELLTATGEKEGIRIVVSK